MNLKRCMTCGTLSEHGFCEKHRDASIYEMPEREDLKGKKTAQSTRPHKELDGLHGGIRCANSQVPVSIQRRPCFQGKVVGKAANGELIREVGKGLKTVGGAKVIENQSQRERWNAYERQHE
jgi:hypothetical protein